MSVLPVDASDFAPTGPWDSGGVDYGEGTTAAGVRTGPVINCSQWHSVYLWQRVFSGSVLLDITVTWFSDAAGLLTVGGREFQYDSSCTNALEANLRNLGPYVQVVVTPNNLSTVFQNGTKILFNNRASPFPTMPDGIPQHYDSPNIPASGSETFVWPQNLTGRFAAYVNGGNQGVNISWQFLHISFLYLEFNNYNVAANAIDYREMLGPNCSTQMIITNLSATTTNVGVKVSAILSTSGP